MRIKGLRGGPSALLDIIINGQCQYIQCWVTGKAGVITGSETRIWKERYQGASLPFVVLCFFFTGFTIWIAFMSGLGSDWFLLVLVNPFFWVFTVLGIRELFKARSAVVILSEHWITLWISGKKWQTLVLGSDVHISVDLRKIQVNPVTREIRAIKIYKRGLGKIHLRRDDGWTEEHLKELWWALYALDKRYRFQFDYEVELIKKAAGWMTGSQVEVHHVRDHR